MDTIKTFTDLTGITDVVAGVAGADWACIARIPVRRTNGHAAGAFCYKRNRVTGERFAERVHLHRNLNAADLDQTLRHELAHVLEAYQNGRCAGHGSLWVSFARALGCSDRGCARTLKGSEYLNAEKLASARWNYRCDDCGHIIRKVRRPRWDRPEGVTAYHAPCKRAGKRGHLVRVTIDEITIAKEAN